jgi:SAM-dependent MidA family methyltransferase
LLQRLKSYSAACVKLRLLSTALGCIATKARWRAVGAQRTRGLRVLFGPEPEAAAAVGGRPETPLERHLGQLIRYRSGPLSVAEFMAECLTHPTLGYYTSAGDVFGKAGDFVTSPDISQAFGELLGVWAALLWQAAGAPAAIHLVELGPGRGTLMADLLRGVAATPALAPFAAALRVHLVEVSPALRAAQAEALGVARPAYAGEPSATAALPAARFGGTPVAWHASLDSVPTDAPLCALAHEFFDALPVHSFARDADGGWRERLVDLAPAGAGDGARFRLVLSGAPTLAARVLVPRRLAAMPPAAAAALQSLELCPRAGAVWQQLAARVGAAGGGGRRTAYTGGPRAARDGAARPPAPVRRAGRRERRAPAGGAPKGRDPQAAALNAAEAAAAAASGRAHRP